MGVVKNIMVRAVADFSDLIAGSRRAGDAVRDLSNRMNTGLAGSLGGIAAKLAALAGIYVSFEFLKDATSDAIRFDAMMGTLNNRLGDSAVAFNHWADTTGKAMGYSKLQIAEYGNTFSNMLYDAASDQQDLANKTQKFLEASAIVRSKTGLSQEEVSRRMRSAMNMEADGADELGVNVRATAVEHSKAFKELAGGVKSFSDLSSGMQKNVMYTYLLDEVTRRYGNTVSDNAASKTAVFTASLADLRLHMGQAFLPIWTTVLPALTKLINWLDMAAQKAAVFMRVLFGYSADDTTKTAQDNTKAFKAQTGAVNDLAAAKKKAASVAGFDEVNTLTQPSDDPKAGAAGAGGLDAGKPDDKPAKPNVDEGAFQKVIQFAKDVKQGFKDIAQGWSDFWQGIKDHKDIIIASLAAILAPLIVLFGPGMIAGIVTWGISMMAALVPVVAEAWAAAVAFLAVEWPILVIIAAIAALAFGITMLIMHWQDVKKWAKDTWDGVVKIWEGCAKWFKTMVSDPFMKTWNDLWPGFKKGVTEAWGVLSGAFIGAAKWFWDNVCKPIIDWFVDFAVDVGKGAVKVWDAICNAFKTAATWYWDNVCQPVIDLFVDFATKVGTAAGKVWAAICDAFKTAGTWFKDNVVDTIVTKFDDLKTGVKTAADNAWGAIKTAFSTVKTWFDTNIVTPIKSAFNTIADGLGSGIESAFKLVYNKVAGYFNSMIGMWNKITGSNPITKGLKIDYELPMLAKGGITNGPMAAIIGDNPGGREVVSPLSDLQSHISTAVIQALQFSQPSRGSVPQGDIVLNIDGRQFARIIKPYTDNGGSNVLINRI